MLFTLAELVHMKQVNLIEVGGARAERTVHEDDVTIEQQIQLLIA